MNLVKNRTLHPHLRDEEALVVKNRTLHPHLRDEEALVVKNRTLHPHLRDEEALVVENRTLHPHLRDEEALVVENRTLHPHLRDEEALVVENRTLHPHLRDEEALVVKNRTLHPHLRDEEALVVENRTLHPHLRDEEALVVENAIRLAIDSIINVLYGVNSSRAHQYQRLVADRDKEIQRLESRLTDSETELQLLRRRGCSCGLFGGDHSLPVGCQTSCDPLQTSCDPLQTSCDPQQTSCEHQTGEQDGFEPGCIMDSEMTAEQQECEMSISLGLFARPPSRVSSQSHESALPSSPSRMGLDQSCTSHSPESSGVSEAVRNLPTSPSSIVIKEEPCDIDTVLIKWEMSEDRFRDYQESTGSPRQDTDSPSVQKQLENIERTLRDIPHADSGGHCDPHEEHLRNKKKGVPMSELTEEAQRLKRAAWRAASRRYYARKVARQQANPSRAGSGPFPSRSGPFPSRSGPLPSRSGPLPSRSGPLPSRSGPLPSRSGPFPSRSGPFPSRSGPFPHITDSRYSQPISFAEKRRRTLISELPEESQSLQREAWRAASRRYYARKNAPHETEPTQYAHLLQNIAPSGETVEPNGGGTQTNIGGILCS